MHFVATLVEGDYLYGACVLYNSLMRNGFNGKFVIGCREQAALPLPARKAFHHYSGNVLWIELETQLHFTNYKPHFLSQVLDSYPSCTIITYLDPDIVLNSPFDWINSWSEGGPAVCGDVNWWMPVNHPTRRQWMQRTGLKARHHLELYFNGGFLSVRRDDCAFLSPWANLIERWGDSDIPLDAKGEVGAWRIGGRWLPFMTPDQDALNIAVMCWQGSINTLGPEVMGFDGFGELPHAIGSNKPWQRNNFLEALLGIPPRYVDKVFWAYADSPLMPFSKPVLKMKRVMLIIATALTRFYRK